MYYEFAYVYDYILYRLGYLEVNLLMIYGKFIVQDGQYKDVVKEIGYR